MSKFSMAWSTELARMGREYIEERAGRRPVWERDIPPPTVGYYDGPECVFCGCTRYDSKIERGSMAMAHGKTRPTAYSRCQGCRRTTNITDVIYGDWRERHGVGEDSF